MSPGLVYGGAWALWIPNLRMRWREKGKGILKVSVDSSALKLWATESCDSAGAPFQPNATGWGSESPELTS